MADNRPTALQHDPYGENIELMKFDWRDERVMKWIAKFTEFGELDSKGNIQRQRAIQSGALLRSVKWRTWNDCGGNRQVFEAKYLYYSKFVELALGRGMPFIGLPPAIAGRKWQPIRMPDGRPRRAKPSIPTEMRKRARKFTGIVRDHFSFTGVAMLIYAMRSDDPMADQINRRLFSRGLNGRTFR